MGLGDLHHKNKIRVPRATIKQTSSYSIRILLLFYFCVSLLWFVDCFVVLLLAMTTPQHRHCDYETVIARLCRRSENLVIETTTHNPHRHCEGLKSPWQSQHGTLRDSTISTITNLTIFLYLHHHYKSHHSHAIPLHHNKHTIISKLYIK